MNDPHPVKVLRGATSFSDRPFFPVFRAGSWADDQDHMRAGDRAYAHPDGRKDDLGFRVMKTTCAPATWCALRGGSWNDNQNNARSAYSYWYDPDGRVDDVGFRVMRGSL